jgi:hypothetical protein
MPDWLVTLSDYAALILVLGGVVALVGRWTRNGIVAAIQPQLTQITERLDSAEAQLKANGGRSLRDAINRIEQAQRLDRIKLNQIAHAINDAGLKAPVLVETQEDE